MQTLGLSDSTPRSDGRIKALLWPSIQTATDLDYLGTQGMWICTAVAVFSFAIATLTAHPMVGVLVFILYFLGGIGVRERSILAALLVFLCYFVDSFASGVNIIPIVFAAILLSNIRGTWLASRWSSDSPEAELPPRLNETLGDKFTDQMPPLVWPKVRYFYYVYAFFMLAITTAGVIVAFLRSARLPE